MPLPPLNEFFLYGFNTQCRLYWIWSLPVSAVWNTSWPRLKESERGPDWWLSGDRFLFPALHASLPGEIMVVSVCQLELSLSLLLQASYSHALLPGRCEREGGWRKERQRVFSSLDTAEEQSINTPWCNWRVSKEVRREPRLSVTFKEPAVQLTDNPPPPPCVGLVQSAGLSWQADRASWRTGQHRNRSRQGTQSCSTHTSTRVALDLLTGRVCVCVKERERERERERKWESMRCLWVGVGFHEHVSVIEI